MNGLSREVSQRQTILVICVNYHNEDEAAHFVQKVLLQEGEFDLQTVIVDNNEGYSGESLLAELAQQERQLLLLQPRRNLGYFGGAAMGLEKYLTVSPLPEWVIVSNTDISFQGNQVLASLTRHYEANISTIPAIIAPSIISTATGANQNPFMYRRPSRLRMHFYKWVFGFYTSLVIYRLLSHIKGWLISKTKTNNFDLVSLAKHSIKPIRIYAPHGSFIIFNRRYFEGGGTLNYGAFLFGEEIFVAETAQRLGLRIVYDPRLRIIHSDHFARVFPISRETANHIRQGAAYCADAFF